MHLLCWRIEIAGKCDHLDGFKWDVVAQELAVCRKKKWIVSLTAILLLVVTPAGAARFNEREMDILNKGGVVRRVSPDSGENQTYGGAGWTVVKSPLRKVWKAILDWDSYTAIYPNTLETKELTHNRGRHLLRMRIGHPIIQVKYHVDMKSKWKTKRIAFALNKDYPNDLEEVYGYWQLFPLPDGNTLVAYVFHVKVPRGILQVLTKSFERMALHRLLGAPWHLKKWVEEESNGKHRAS